MRRRVVRVGAVIGVAGVVGAVLVIASSARGVDVAGIVLLGGALVALVAWVFYEIGLSEDRERERERPPRV